MGGSSLENFNKLLYSEGDSVFYIELSSYSGDGDLNINQHSTGNTYGNYGNVWLLKIDKNLNLIWKKNLTQETSDRLARLFVNSHGIYYYLLQTHFIAPFDSIQVSTIEKYDHNGNLSWRRENFDTAHLENSIWPMWHYSLQTGGMQINAAGEIFKMAPYMNRYQPNPSDRLSIKKLDPDGNQVWAARIDTTVLNTDSLDVIMGYFLDGDPEMIYDGTNVNLFIPSFDRTDTIPGSEYRTIYIAALSASDGILKNISAIKGGYNYYSDFELLPNGNILLPLYRENSSRLVSFITYNTSTYKYNSQYIPISPLTSIYTFYSDLIKRSSPYHSNNISKDSFTYVFIQKDSLLQSPRLILYKISLNGDLIWEKTIDSHIGDPSPYNLYVPTRILTIPDDNNPIIYFNNNQPNNLPAIKKLNRLSGNVIWSIDIPYDSIIYNQQVYKFSSGNPYIIKTLHDTIIYCLKIYNRFSSGNIGNIIQTISLYSIRGDLISTFISSTSDSCFVHDFASISGDNLLLMGESSKRDCIYFGNPTGAYDVHLFTLQREVLSTIGRNENSKEHISVTPSPNSGLFTLIFTAPFTGQIHVNIYNTSGATVYSATVQHQQNTFLQINEQLPAGSYFIMIQTGKEVWSEKFVTVK